MEYNTESLDELVKSWKYKLSRLAIIQFDGFYAIRSNITFQYRDSCDPHWWSISKVHYCKIYDPDQVVDLFKCNSLFFILKKGKKYKPVKKYTSKNTNKNYKTKFLNI